MLTGFQWFALLSISAIAIAGGALPLLQPQRARRSDGFPAGQAFSVGVFLALSLLLMLPAGFHLFGRAFPEINYPLAPLMAIGAYVTLLGMAHLANAQRKAKHQKSELSTPAIPIVMTIMIAIPSFLLGTAIGLSEASASASMIYMAVMAHKGTAGFALALSLVRSTLPRPWTIGIFCMFAFSTPMGIVVGADVQAYLTGHGMLVAKALVLSAASGVFLYMATLHDFKNAPMIVDCGTRKGFAWMVFGLVVTGMVKWVLALAHAGG